MKRTRHHLVMERHTSAVCHQAKEIRQASKTAQQVLIQFRHRIYILWNRHISYKIPTWTVAVLIKLTLLPKRGLLQWRSVIMIKA